MYDETRNMDDVVSLFSRKVNKIHVLKKSCEISLFTNVIILFLLNIIFYFFLFYLFLGSYFKGMVHLKFQSFLINIFEIHTSDYVS